MTAYVMRIMDWSSDVCSSDLGGGDRVGRDEPHQQPRRGARIAHFQRRFGLEQPADADPVYHPGAVVLADDRRAHAAHRGRGGQHVLAFEQPGDPAGADRERAEHQRSEEHTSELQSLMRISYAVFCLKKKKYNILNTSIATK